MSDFVLSVYRGLHPPFLIFLVLGVAARIGERKWNGFDTLLISGFAFFEFLTALQVWMFYGQLATSRRYLWMFIPLYLPYAAHGATALWEFGGTSRKRRFLVWALFAAFAASALFNAFTPVRKEYSSPVKRTERLMSREVAARIREDWATLPAGVRPMPVKCDVYQSGRRPLVDTRWRRVGYLCGGQAYPEFFRALNIPPDYIVSPKESPAPPGYVLVGAVRVGGKTAYIRKRRELRP